MTVLSCAISPFITDLTKKYLVGFHGACYHCNFDPEGYLDSNVKYLLGENLHASLTRAVIKRKSEFVAGRYLAKKALIDLGVNTTQVAIGENRAPVWPNSFIGSISHSQGFAICAVANTSDIKRIGLDVENYLEAKVAKDILPTVLIESEYPWVGTKNNPNPQVFTLIFSAKESLFKALYPEVGHYFDFDVAQIKTIDYQTGKFSLQLVQALGPTLPVGTCFDGIFELHEHQVLTLIVSQNDVPPA